MSSQRAGTGGRIVWQTDRGTTGRGSRGPRRRRQRGRLQRTGRRVLTYSEDGTARIMGPRARPPELRMLAHQKVSLTGADVAGDGRAARHDRRRRDRTSLSRGGRNVRAAGSEGPRRGFSPDGTLVATASGDRMVRIWTREGVIEARVRLPGTVTLSHSVPMGARSPRPARGGRDLGIEGTPKPLRVLDAGPGIVRLSFSPDGKRLVTAGSDGRGQIWNIATGQREHVLTGHRDRLTSARFSPDGTLVVTASADHDAIVWDARTGEDLSYAPGHTARSSAMLRSAPTDAGSSRPAPAWPVCGRSGRESLLTFLDGHVGLITSAEFGEEGYDVFTAGQDGTVRKYTCEVCAPVSGLLALADRRLAGMEDSPR